MQINTCGRRLAFFNGAMDASVVVCAPLAQDDALWHHKT
jgi:hypothetical protein